MHLFKNTLFTIQKRSFTIPVEIAGMFTKPELITGKVEYARLIIYKDAVVMSMHEARVTELTRYLKYRYGLIITSVSHES